MSPEPEKESSEAKEPDKCDKQAVGQLSGGEINIQNEAAGSGKSEQIEVNSMSTISDEKSEAPGGDVSDLNDGELRALLDEAYNYKSPKDREGKSEIFKKFLQEAETAETETQQPSLLFAEAPVRVTGGKRRSGRREVAVSERQSRCGSLQNLSQCHVEYPTSRRSRHVGHLRRGASTSSTCSSATCESVSTRQREGGSLPCSVNAVHDLAGTNMATLRAGDVTAGVPSLEDLTSWHSTYSMPRLATSQPESEVGVATPEVTSDVEQCSRVKTSPGFENTTCSKPEMKAELVTRVEAVNCEKQKIRERAEEQLNDTEEVNPKYRSHMAWEINNSKPTQVDEVTDISYFRGIENFCLLQLHPTHDGNVIIPSSANVNLEISEGNAVRSVLGSSRQDSKCVISRGGSDRNKPPYYVSSNIQSAPHNYFQCSEPSAIVSSQQKDDNGNYVREDKQADNCTTSAQKGKRKKEREKNVKMTEEIEGFKGHEDLDSLLMYIEGEEKRAEQNNKSSKQKSKTKEVLCRRSHRHSEESDNARDKRGKFKETNSAGSSSLKRANSLEEVSKTKLEDFTDPTDSSRSVGEGRTSQLSIDFDDIDDEGAQYYCAVTSDTPFYPALDTPTCHAEHAETEFHVVTKKQRKKKQSRRSENSEDAILSFYRVKNDRRKCKSTSSMPPSDQSGDSDSDSIHSLPVSSTTKKPTIDKTSTSSGGTPQASYADIARMAGDNHKIRVRSHKNSDNMEEWPDMVRNQDSAHKYQDSAQKNVETTHKPIRSHKNSDNTEEWPDMVTKNQDQAHKNQETTHKSVKIFKTPETTTENQDVTSKIHEQAKISSDNMVEWPEMMSKVQDYAHKIQDNTHKSIRSHKNSENTEEWPDVRFRNHESAHKHQDSAPKYQDNAHKTVKNCNNVVDWPEMSHKSVIKNSDNCHKLNDHVNHKIVKNCIEWSCDSSSATPPCEATPPAVILSDDVESGDVSGLTFGFEINDELLTTSSRELTPIFVQHKHLDKQAVDIVNFVGKAWDLVVSELGHVTQGEVRCAPVQYFKCP